jgi:hypothetical protein
LDLSDVLNLLSSIAVLAGVIFAVVELRNAGRNRRDAAAVAVVGTVQSQEVRQAMRDILALPERVEPHVIRDDPALLDAALAVDSACEMWGSMVFEGVVDHHMLDRMVGGWIRASWSRLEVWIESEREVLNSENVAEWWQWIVELLENDPDPGKAEGAHIAYRHQTRRA